MLHTIQKILRDTPQLKARQIAKTLGRDKTEVNGLLYKYPDIFIQDENYGWSLIKSGKLEVKLPVSWVDGKAFEKALQNAGSPLERPVPSVTFIVPEGCKIFLEAATRLLALCNQLVLNKKTVTIDFSDCQSTLTYFNRIGFLDHLDSEVIVLPGRPQESWASKYKSQNDAVVEFGKIDPVSPDQSIPELLKKSFVKHAGEEYSGAAFTVIAELFGNVEDHSQTPIPGYAALQLYRGCGKVKPHIQTVISDSGKGIVGTLKPILAERYPALAAKLDFSNALSEVELVKEVFNKGRISQSTDEGRGLGLKRSRDMVAKYDANISIRQESFELRMLYRNGRLSSSSHSLNLPKILGTHICFDLFLNVQ